MKNNYFFIGLIILYSGMVLSGGWKLYFLTYILVGFLFYLEFRDIKKVIYLISVASIPYSIGPFSTQILSEGTPFSSSLGITPFTLSTALLALLLLIRPIDIKIKSADLIITVFIIYGIIGFVVSPTQTSYLYGLIQLLVLILFYFNSRRMLSDKQIQPYVIWILFSIIVFESLITVMQFLMQRPLGLFIEEYLQNKPYGLISPENELIYRSSGTLTHSNYLAALIVSIFPIIILKEFNILKKIRFVFPIIICLSILAVTVTFSRTSWLLLLLVFIFFIFHNKLFTLSKKYFLQILVFSILFLGIFLLTFPSVSNRLRSIPYALTDMGSFGLRMKVIGISLSILPQSFIFGIGLNQFSQIAPDYTDEQIFNVNSPSSTTLIHNIFFQIATEMGVPALIIFIVFLLLLFKEFRKNKSDLFKQVSYLGLLVYLGAGMVNPFFLRVLMRLFFLLSAIILA